MHRRLEAVTVCVNYGDFLEETVKHNKHLFDRWLIVTTAADHETRDVCRRHSLSVLLSEDGYRDRSSFAKGRLIERGLQHLSADGWRLHLDADIVLPSNMHHLLEAAHLDENYIYGADRVMVKSYEDWLKLRNSGWVTHHSHCTASPPRGYEIGSRWVHHAEGYVPIGFFQLWHSQQDLYWGTRVKPYPAIHNDACRTDVQHALQWDRRKRALIPEMFVVHLESEVAQLGANWKGRTTKRFGPPRKHHDRKAYN